MGVKLVAACEGRRGEGAFGGGLSVRADVEVVVVVYSLCKTICSCKMMV